MRPWSIAVFFICLISIPIAQVLADSHFGGSRVEVWHGQFDRHQVVTSGQHHLLFEEFPWLHNREKTG
jgi:hypothetical protein